MTTIALAATAITMTAASPAGATSFAPAVPVIVLEHTYNLVDGQLITAAVVGASPYAGVAFFECGLSGPVPEPRIVGTIFDNGLVGCSPGTDVFADANGVAQMTFTVHTGVVGPPRPGMDTAGNDGSVDAANYPCDATTECAIKAMVGPGLTVQQRISFAGSSSTNGGISFSPLEAPRATAVHVYGIGANPSETFSIKFRNPNGWATVCHGRANAIGEYSCTGPIPASAAIGTHRLRLVHGTSVLDEAALTVTS